MTKPRTPTEQAPPAAGADADADAIRLYGPQLTGNPDELYREIRNRHGRVALDRELRHLPAARSPPALPHTVTDWPGSSISTVTSGASSCSVSGRPTSGGNVPQWHGTQRFTPSSSSASAAWSGPIV